MDKIRNKAYFLLRRSESFFKTDMVYLSKGGFWLILGYALQMVFGLTLLVVFANVLPKEIYGSYQFILSMTGIVSIFTLTGMGTAIMHAAARGSKSALQNGFRVQLKWSIGISIASLTLVIYYFLRGNTVLSGAFLIVGILQPFISGFSLYKPFITSKQLFKESSILETLQKIFPFVTLLPTVFLTRNILIIVFVYFASHFLSLLFAFKFVTYKYPSSPIPDPELENYSKHLSFMGAFSRAAGDLDKVLIWYFLGAAPVAVYTLAQIPITHIRSLFQLVNSLTFPKLVKKSFNELKSILPEKIRSYFFAVSAVVMLYILSAPFLYKIFFPTYPESIIYSQVLALTLLAVPRSLIAQAFTAHIMKSEQYIIKIIGPLIKIILLFALVPIYKMWGLIIAILLSEYAVTLLQWYLFQRKT